MIHFDLCVVRHGETLENRINIYQGHLDTVLSDVGIKQAELVAKRLQDEKFTHAYSSDLQRAYKTGGYILSANKHAKDLVMVQDPRIREKKYGIFEGKQQAEVQAFAREHNIIKLKDYTPKGGETLKQLAERAVDFFDELCRNLAQDAECGQNSNDVSKSLQARVESASNSPPVANVLITCHGGTIRQLFYHFARNMPSEFLNEGKKQIAKLSPNTGVSKFEVFVDKITGKAAFIRCLMIYDGSHLTSEEEQILYEQHAL